MIIDGTTVTFEIAPDDGLFAESPTFETFTDVRHVESVSSGRTTEIDTSQPGRIDALVAIRDRGLDLAYGPASVTFDGSGSDYWGCGDLAAFNAATELDVRLAVAADDWTPAAAMTMCGQWLATGNQRCWQFDIDTNGFLSFSASGNGSSVTTVNSGVRACAVNGQMMCVRVAWQSSGATRFYVKRTRKGRERFDCLSHDNWLPLGAQGTGLASALFNSTATVTVGDRAGATNPFDGSVVYADARTSIGSDTLVFAFWPADAASASATSWTASAGAGETWTKTGSSTVTIQGDYFNRVGSGTPVRLMAERGGSDYALGYGYLRRAPQEFPSSGKDAVARLAAVDTLGWLADQQAPSTPSQFGTGTVGHYWPLHEDNNVLQSSDVIGSAPGTWSSRRAAGGPTQPGAPNLPTQALIEGTYLVSSEVEADIDWSVGVILQFSFYLDRPGAIFRVMCSNGTNTIGVNYGVGGEYYMMGNGAAIAELFDNRLDTGWHTFVMYSNGGSGGSIFAEFDASPISGSGARSAASFPTALYVDGSAAAVSDVALYEESTENAAAYLGPNGGAGQTSAERMTALLQAAMGNVPGLWDLTTDASTYLGPTALGVSYGELCRQVAIGEQGRFHQDADGTLVFRSRCEIMTGAAYTTSQATFGEDTGAGEVPYCDIGVDPGSREDVINDVTVILPNGTSGNYVDRESVEHNGRRSITYAAPLAAPADAVALAKHIVGLRAWPQVRITNLVINPLGNNDAWTQVLTRKQGDRITVKRRTTDTLTPSVVTQPITAEVVIEQISHSIDRDGTWRTTFLTSPAPLTAAEAGYFTLDDAVLGALDAGNVLAY